jgi:sugar (pentulose or hexulose) kinase
VSLLLALDVGTQSTRAIVFDADGRIVGRRQVAVVPYVAPHPGWAEQDPMVYWDALVAACQGLWEDGIDPTRIIGTALTTQRSTLICCDGAGRPLRPAMVWLDQRRSQRPPPLGLGWELLLRAVGARDLLAHFQAESEANWLAESEPEVWARTERFLLLSGWLTHRLSGRFVDASGAQVGYIPFDYRRQQWAGASDPKWRALAVRRQQLPDLVPTGQRMGELTPEAAAALGLPPGLPLIAAAADKACEVLGCGAVDADTAQLSFGTTATINTTQLRYVEVQRLLPAYPAALPGAWNTEIQIYRGFWMVSWFKREFAERETALAEQLGVAPETLLDELLGSVPPGSMGLTLQPYWSPGVREPGPEAKGAIIGFGDVHTRAHVYRAIIEGLCYGLRGGREQIEKRLGHKLRRLVVAGGGAQSDQAMQIAANVFNLPAERPETTETSALGAAINVAVAMGLHADYPTAIAAMVRSGQVFMPQPEAVATYDALYREVYRPMYRRLQPLYRAIRRITGYPAN